MFSLRDEKPTFYSETRSTTDSVLIEVKKYFKGKKYHDNKPEFLVELDGKMLIF
jgi:hypothetical protein